MSTIEKAAARLSARQKRRSTGLSAGHAEPGRNKSNEGVLPLTRESSAPVSARYCDIDVHDVQERGYLTPRVGRSRLAQEMRRIKRPLLLNIQKARATEDGSRSANLIMVTSALPGEGKTFVSINLAMSIAAEVDRRVLLVDADVARGDVSRQLHLQPQRGLSDLLQESSYLAEDGVLMSNIERLSILPSGAPTDHVDELFASGMMAVLTRALAEADPERVVIFDASPLLATTEAAVLAQRMGQTVVVVEANKTPQGAIGQALSQLEGCANVSLVLNKTTGGSPGGYGYGYGEGGYGYGDDERTQKGEVA